jgi:hypothetical protein
VVIARDLPRCCCAAIAARAADPGTLSPSLLAYAGHPAYGLDALRCHLDASPSSSAATTASTSSSQNETRTRANPATPQPARLRP